MEIIVTLATKFWQWSILIAVVIVTFLINLLDKKKKDLGQAHKIYQSYIDTNKKSKD